jgi:hypothetical protein
MTTARRIVGFTLPVSVPPKVATDQATAGERVDKAGHHRGHKEHNVSLQASLVLPEL